MRTREVYQAIKEQCRYCASLEPEHTCNGQTFWSVMCPFWGIPSNLFKHEYLTRVKQYCAVCQALNKNEAIHECEHVNCRLCALGLNQMVIGQKLSNSEQLDTF